MKLVAAIVAYRNFILSLFVAVIFSPWSAYASKTPSQKEFAKIYQKNLKELRKKLPANSQDPCTPAPNYDSSAPQIAPITSPQALHLPIPVALSEFCATQSMYSFYKIELELNKSKPSEKTVDYVLYKGRRYLVDGHHHLLLSIYLGRESISARVVGKLPDTLSPIEFFQEMKRLNFIYDQLIDPMEMQDHPYLNKIRELVHDTELEGTEVILKGKSQRGYMIGAIAPNKPNYAEQRLAEIIEESGEPLKDLDAETTLKILVKAKKNNDPRAEIFIPLDKPFKIENSKDFEEAQDLIRDKIKPHHCSQWLQQDNLP